MEQWITLVELWGDAITMPIAVVDASVIVSAAFLVAVLFVTAAFLACACWPMVKALSDPTNISRRIGNYQYNLT